MTKLSNIHPFSFLTDFQLKFYRVRIFYLCCNCKQNNWWRNKVDHAWSI